VDRTTSALFAAGECTTKELLQPDLQWTRDLRWFPAQVDARDASGHTALLWAASQGHEGIVELLLSKGADPKAANAYQRTPLVSAAEAGHTRVCEILLDRGAAINAQSDYGSTALMCAALNGHSPVVELLLARGADRKLENRDGVMAHELTRDWAIKAIFRKVRPSEWFTCMVEGRKASHTGPASLSRHCRRPFFA
jgi:ankyrin repeat protein